MDLMKLEISEAQLVIVVVVQVPLEVLYSMRGELQDTTLYLKNLTRYFLYTSAHWRVPILRSWVR